MAEEFRHGVRKLSLNRLSPKRRSLPTKQEDDVIDRVTTITNPLRRSTSINSLSNSYDGIRIRTARKRRKCVILLLPEEIQLHILNFLTSRDLAVAQCVCTKWRTMAGDRAVWKNKIKGIDARKYRGMSSYRIVVTGSGGVGKSALTVCFVEGKFVTKYDPTIEDSYAKQMQVDGVTCDIDVMDTAGPEEFGVLTDQYIKVADGIVLVYNIASLSSFEGIMTRYRKILRLHEDKRPPVVMLVGNKCDLENERQVPFEKGKMMANRNLRDEHVRMLKKRVLSDEKRKQILDAGGKPHIELRCVCNFMETSAKTGKNVNQVFAEVVRQIDEWRTLEGWSEAERAEGIRSLKPNKKKKRNSAKQCVMF